MASNEECTFHLSADYYGDPQSVAIEEGDQVTFGVLPK
jgi:hypothetical protein